MRPCGHAAMRLLEDLLSSLRACFETFPDGRRGANRQYSMADFGMSAFSVFFMQSPSFLAHQRRLEEGHGRSNCQSLFGMGKIPSDNRIRDMLDPVSPGLLNSVFFEVASRLEQEKEGLNAFWRLARQKHGSRNQFFNTIAAVTAFLFFPSWEDFLQTIAFVKAPPAPP